MVKPSVAAEINNTNMFTVSVITWYPFFSVHGRYWGNTIVAQSDTTIVTMIGKKKDINIKNTQVVFSFKTREFRGEAKNNKLERLKKGLHQTGVQKDSQNITSAGMSCCCGGGGGGGETIGMA